jgi:hypothetical protein
MMVTFKVLQPKGGMPTTSQFASATTGANMAQQCTLAKKHQQYNPASLLLFLAP